MRIAKIIIASGVALTLAACGTQNEDKSNKAPEAQQETEELSAADKEALEAEFGQIPTATIVRVPVDESGEATGEPEMRVVNGAINLDDDAQALAGFEAGSAPEALADADELDADSSTQSWNRWAGYGYGHRGHVGYGAAYNTRLVHYRSTYHAGYWRNNYRPRLAWRGYRWNYGFARSYVRAGYRYSCYRPVRYW